ncbi:hypothetical protein GCWU000325_00637 [Alloprevotella tannerae ATCC 51259]|uniref:Uncharacterized protein n=1 Tax=Alloprevotella tannerae ATCC 51259 TaxID=626522 RepID=C9LEK7_9BACT|nr:hypothetical protein GCWU000325_00637 [Alloprevotella tannerae ATCC 51259]
MHLVKKRPHQAARRPILYAKREAAGGGVVSGARRRAVFVMLSDKQTQDRSTLAISVRIHCK